MEKSSEEYIENFDAENKGLMTKLKNFLDGKFFMPVIILLVAITAFVLGRLSKIEEMRESVKVYTSPEVLGEVKGASVSATPEVAQVVASKNGAKYHYPWCPGAKQISEKNLITFESIEAARAKGYTPAANCKGLK